MGCGLHVMPFCSSETLTNALKSPATGVDEAMLRLTAGQG